MVKKKKNKTVKKISNKKTRFLKLLIKLSMKHAENSHDSIKDFFIAQALRLDHELEQLETKQSDTEHKLHGNS
jgi:hypothetical protein